MRIKKWFPSQRLSTVFRGGTSWKFMVGMYRLTFQIRTLHSFFLTIPLRQILRQVHVSHIFNRNVTTGYVYKGIFVAHNFAHKMTSLYTKVDVFTQDKRRSSITWLFYRNDDRVFPSPSRLDFHGMTCYKNNQQQHILKDLLII